LSFRSFIHTRAFNPQLEENVENVKNLLFCSKINSSTKTLLHKKPHTLSRKGAFLLLQNSQNPVLAGFIKVSPLPAPAFLNFQKTAS